jgi:heme exporter protein A
MTATDIFAGSALACMRGERPVFAGLDFVIESGGALVLTGPNGSGKSSLLRLMAGLLQPVGGHLSWNGLAVLEEPDIHRQRVAYLGHLSAAKPLLTPAEDVAFWVRYRAPSLRRSEVTARVQESLAWAGLGGLADMPSRFLSAGQKQRLALARLTAHPTARLWLLDEPTTGLDSAGTAAMAARLAAHRARGGMVVAATHQRLDLPQAQELDLGVFARRRVEAGLQSALLDAVA